MQRLAVTEYRLKSFAIVCYNCRKRTCDNRLFFKALVGLDLHQQKTNTLILMLKTEFVDYADRSLLRFNRASHAQA